jgi:MFS family permease
MQIQDEIISSLCPEMAKHQLYNFQFWLLCLSSMFFMGSFNMLIPDLPDFLSNLGGAEYKGYIISLFTLTAAISRPFSGKLVDLVGRKPIMIYGAFIAILCSISYVFLYTVIGFFALRLLHGMSTGFAPTGRTAYLADIVPFNKRGEAMGILGISGSLGMAGGPALGSEVAKYFGLDTMFYVSAAMALISIMIVMPMKETLPNPQRFSFKMLKIKVSDIYEPKVIGPSLIMFLYAYSFGTVLTITPDFSEYLNVGNKGLYFTTFFLASLFSRIIAGKISDKKGRVVVLKAGLMVFSLGLITTALASSKWSFLGGGLLYGFGAGITGPTIFAWTIDLSDNKHRGRGISFMYLAMEIGIGIGAFASGLIYANNNAHLANTFWASLAMVIVALIYLFIAWSNKKQDPVVVYRSDHS